jgi:hypothetical protein
MAPCVLQALKHAAWPSNAPEARQLVQGGGVAGRYVGECRIAADIIGEAP